MAGTTIARTRPEPRVRVVADYEACGVEGRDNWAGRDRTGGREGVAEHALQPSPIVSPRSR
jgi:hypothetical protein